MPHKLPNRLRLRILGNSEILGKIKIAWRKSLVPSLPSRNKTFVKAVKNYTEPVIKAFCFSSILPDFCTLFQIFCQGL